MGMGGIIVGLAAVVYGAMFGSFKKDLKRVKAKASPHPSREGSCKSNRSGKAGDTHIDPKDALIEARTKE